MIELILTIVSILSASVASILTACKIFDWFKNKRKRKNRKDIHMTQSEMFDLIIEMLNDNNERNKIQDETILLLIERLQKMNDKIEELES